MLVTRSRYHFTSQASDRFALLHDKEIPSLAKSKGWPAVCLCDERTMAGAISFLTAARESEITAAVGIQVSHLALESNGTTCMTVNLIALNQDGLHRLMSASGPLQVAETVDGVLQAMEGTKSEKPNVLVCYTLTAPVQNSAYMETLAARNLAIGLGPSAAILEPGGDKNATPLCHHMGTTQIHQKFKMPLIRLQTAYTKKPFDAENTLAMTKLATAKATAQAKKTLNDAISLPHIQLPEANPQDVDPVSERIIKAITPMHLDNPPTLPARLGLTENDNPDEILTKLAYDGLEARLDDGRLLHDESEAWKRLNYELDIIRKKGFCAYFLIIRDAIIYAKSQEIPVGPGRGSVAGSLVAWCVDITTIDPLRHKLIFERFINPERKALPDIDTDFCAARRHEVFAYLARKYGAERIAHISTYAENKPRGAVRDAARILSLQNLAESVIRRAESIPDKSLTDLERFEKIAGDTDGVSSDERRIANLAAVSLGTPSTLGVHAGGIVMSDEPTTQWSPVHASPSSDGLPVAQMDMETIENSGLTKFDFLSLKTLTAIALALSLIKTKTGKKIDIESIGDDDPSVYKFISTGWTQTIFQLEQHRGIGQKAKEIGIDSMSDIIALVALYRPGPMEFISTYAERKQGKTPTEYPHYCLENILKETYGIIVYQEQIMHIAQEFAGYTAGEADTLRKAVGKKKAEILEKERSVFISRAVRNGRTEEDADTLFQFILPFASYGFNKSHAAAYAKVTYQTAWLRVHYPAEWYSAVSALKTQKKASAETLIVARNAGVEIILPSLEGPTIDYETTTNEKGQGVIRVPLSFIEGTKTGSLAAIEEAKREAGGRFGSMIHFLSLLSSSHNSTISALIDAGATDCLSEQPPTISRALFHTLLADPTTERLNPKADDRQGFLLMDEKPTVKTKDPTPKELTQRNSSYAPLRPSDAESIQNIALNFLPAPKRGSSTTTSDWRRKIEGLMTITAAQEIAKAMPAHALAVLTKLDEQKESLSAGIRILEATVEDETGKYAFDIAAGTHISPELAGKKRPTVAITLEPAPDTAFIAGKPLITRISLCSDPLGDEKPKWPLIYTETEITDAIRKQIGDAVFVAMKKYSTERRTKRGIVRPGPNPNHILLVAPSLEITPVEIPEAIRYYGIENTIGSLPFVERIVQG